MRLKSPEETINWAYTFAKELKPPVTIALTGDLGSGKTTLAKGIASFFGIKEVTSPTFVYLNIYKGSAMLYHFDLYRLKKASDFFAMGFDEFLGKGIVLIEWADFLLPHLSCTLLDMKVLDETTRELTITKEKTWS